MKLSEYLKQNDMSLDDFLKMQKRKEEGKTSYGDYQRKLYQEIKNTDLSDIEKDLSSNKFLDQETLTYYNDRVSQVADKVSRFQMGDAESNKSFLDNLKALQSGITKASDYYSTFKDEDDYKAQLKSIEQKNEWAATDTKALKTELDTLKTDLETAKSKQSALDAYKRSGVSGSGTSEEAKFKNELASILKKHGYSSIDEFETAYSEKNQYYNNATRYQEGIALRDNAKNAEDFDKYSKSGADIENPTVDEYYGGFSVGDWRPFGKNAGNKVTYSRKNYDEALKKATSGQPGQPDLSVYGVNELYNKMTDEEVDIYNYYLSKEGEEKADQFLDSITESLNYRQAEAMFEDGFRNKALLEGILGFSAGLDQWASGVKSLFNNDGEYVPQSVTQMMGGMAREDLTDDYGIIGQGAYDLVNTTGNMLPSILISHLTGGIGGAVGLSAKAAGTVAKVAGAATLGSSAAGNGYQEMINLGYDKSQAKAYGTLVGVSEAGLEYLLGGISSLGGTASGGITNKIVTKLISNVDNAIAKVAIGAGGKLVGSMVSEFGEEYLQEVLDPVFKNITLKTDEDIKLFSTEALYSGILGALSAGLLEGGSSISSEVSTYKAGKDVKNTGQLSNLKKFGTSFSADTVAYKIASQVNENTDAYTIGQLLHEVGADSLSEANMADIVKSLERKGIESGQAQTIAKWLNNAVMGENFNPLQRLALKNPDISQTFKDVIINQNSTVNQRMQGYTDILQNIATEKANQKANNVKVKADKKADKTKTAEENTTTPFIPYSNEEIARRQASGEVVVDSKGKPITTTENASENKFEVNIDGKTVNVKTGDEVNVSEIASIDNGKMTFKLDNGETVDAEDISFGTEDEGLIYSTVLDMGVNAAVANSLVKNYNPSDKLSAKQYAMGIKEAYKYGSYGMPINEISKKGFAADLSVAQRTHAYNLGKVDTAAKVEKAQKEVEKAASGKGGFEGKVHFKGDTLALKEVQRESLKRMGVLSEVLGVDFHVFESYMQGNSRVFKDTDGKVKKAPNGYYKDGKIYIDLNAGKDGQGIMIYTVAHELTHWIREWSPAKFKILADFLMEQYGEKGHNVNDLVQAQIDKAKKNKREIDYDEAYEEVIADSMETMLSDDAVYEKILELKCQDASIVKKIGEFLAKIVDGFKKLMKQYPPETPEGKLVSQMNDSFSKLQELFAEALVDASNNYQANKGQKNTTSEGDVKFMARYVEKGKKRYYNEFNSLAMRWAYSASTNVGDTKIFNDKGRSFALLEATEDGYIEIARGSYKEVYSEYEQLYSQKDRSFHGYLEEIRSAKRGDFRNLQSTENRGDVTRDNQQIGSQKIQDKSTRNNEYLQSSDKGKHSIKHSDRDTLGNTLTEAQQSYFAESKVRDENGNLKVMYRGDSNEFTVFDRKKTNYANLYGRGFYFTERKEHAEQYGKSREFYLNIKTPLSLKQNNITKSQMLKFLEAIENDGEDYDLYNYGSDATAQTVLDSVWGKGDYEMLQDISAGAIGDLVAAVELFNEINGTTYDGIVLPTETIIFNSEQAKLTSNKNPTADKDIRFSDRDIERLETLNNQLRQKQNEIYDLAIELRKFKKNEAQDKLYSVMDKEGVTQEELDNALSEYAEWERNSGYADMQKKETALKDELQSLRREVQKIEDSLHKKLLEQISHFSDEEIKKYVSKAVRRYHTTSRLSNASYLLTTGSMLDFSDGQGYRVKDHREISEILDLPEYAEYSDGMIAFMNMGNIRLQTYGIDISQAPNQAQKSALRDIISQIMRNEGGFNVDFSKTNGYTDGSVAYPKGTATSKILADIDSYFETGVVPEYESAIAEYHYSERVTDEETLDSLNEQIEKGEYIKVYRSFQVIDGGLYAPMNAVDRDENGKNKRLGYRSEYGVWEKSTESPEIAQRYMDNHPEAPYAKFDLDGVDNKTNAVAYNPYLHASNLVLNDQFAAAYRRNLITVECYVPLSEADGTYKAQYAKDATGWVDWKAGGVAGKLLKVKPEYTRKLFVSRYMLPVRQVPDSEVAAMYKEYLDGTDIAVSWNVVTPSLRQELEKAGVNISYDDVKAGSKTISFNDVFSDEVKFQDRDPDAAENIEKINKQLAKENVKLIEDVKYLKELVKLQSKETHGKMLKKSTVELVAKRLMVDSSAKGNVSELVNHLTDVYSYIAQGEDVSWEGIQEKSQAAVDWMLQHEYHKPVRTELASEILNHLRTIKISLDPMQKKETAHYYGSYGKFHQKSMGRLKITNDGVPLDTVWQELVELYPGFFDRDVNSNDQPLELMRIIDNLQNSYEMDDYYYEDEMYAQWLMEKVYEGYWDVSAVHTVADAKQKEINLLKAKHKERMDALRQSHEDADAKLRQEHREKISQLRTQYREREEAKMKKVAEYYQKSRKEAVDRVKEAREKRDAVTKLQRLVLDTAKWVSYPTKDDVKCPDIIRGPYAEFLSSIDLSSKRLINGGEPTQNDLRVSSAMDSLAKAIEKKLGTQSPDTETESVLDTGYLDLPVHFVENLKELSENLKKRMVTDGHIVNSMTSEEVKELTKFIRTLNHSIKEMSTLYANMRFARVEQLGNDTMVFLKYLGEAKQSKSITNFVTWDNALPYYTFKRFGEAGESVFEELMDAQDKLAYLADGIFKFKEKTWTDKESSEWSKDTHTIKLPGGRELTLTSADAMSIYCLSRREQGRQHLLGGGVRVLGIEKNGKKANDSRSLLNLKDIEAIYSSLTERQKKVAEAIQEYMSTVCSEWGNEISMKRFLTKEFTERFYFPIESNDENLDTKDPKAQQSDLYRLLNISATKPLTKGANNEVIIRNIFDVFTNHSSDMAKLNAYGMALLDYMKWINYREKTVNDDGQISVSGVRKSMERAYGPEAKKYVIGLIKDINGRANDGGDHPFLMKMTRAAKTAMVGANLRVSLLQFTAYPRAAMVLSNKSLALGLTKVPQIEKAKKYCGIALWKSFGFYDTNISRSIEDQIKGTTNIRQKLIELSLKGAEWGDAITWGCLWNACEYEVAKTKQYKVGSEEFNQAVGKKLRDVVYATQVVDSTLTRSQMMRNKSGLTQSVSAFMSEPTLSANILMDAGFQFNLEKRRTGSNKLAWQKTGKYIGKAVAVYSIGQIIVALAESLADAYRDDDDEEFMVKFGEVFKENAISDLNPVNKIPLVADVSEMFLSLMGIGFYSSNSLYSTAYDEFKNAFETWQKVINGEDGKTVYAGIYSTTKLISYITGVSASGLMREVVTLWNNTAGAADPYLKIRTYESSATDKGIAEYKFDKGDTTSVKTTVSKMIEDKVKSGKTEKEAKSAVRASFTSTYKAEYIEAVKNKDYDEMNRIRKFLYATGLYGTLAELDETLKKWRTGE